MNTDAADVMPIDSDRMSADDVRTNVRQRIRPHISDPHYLHCRHLLLELKSRLSEVTSQSTRVLDLYCGARPYRQLLPPTDVGFDIDMHYGSADVVGDLPFPIMDGTFDVVLCTQALCLRPDAPSVVAEMLRVTKPDGLAITTLPHLYRKDGIYFDHRYRRHEIEGLFANWDDVEIRPVGGLGTGLAFVLGSLVAGVVRRTPAFRFLQKPSFVVINVAGWLIDAITKPLARFVPAIHVVVTRRTGARSHTA